MGEKLTLEDYELRIAQVTGTAEEKKAKYDALIKEINRDKDFSVVKRSDLISKITELENGLGSTE